MNISLNWLSSYIDLAGLDNQEMADMLTFAGIEVEGIDTRGIKSELVVVAKVMEKTPLEGSDHLSICQVDAGEGSLRQVVCGAQNYKVGDLVPCALPGSILPGGIEIKEGKMRGVASKGMLCSAGELGQPESVDGLWILPNTHAIGTPICSFTDSDTLFELEITPNRPDLLSHWGMARELAAITGRSLKADPADAAMAALQTEVAPSTGADSITLSDSDRCPLYTATRISGVKVGPSPEWLSERLISIGLRPINNIVDITNYCLFELGHPLHAFDAAKLTGGLNIRPATAGEKFTSLMAKEYELNEGELLISDASGSPLAMAGIMGGLDSGVTESSTDIILEAAWFERSNVRFTARRHMLNSDSSYLFERGTSPWCVLRVAARAIELICECTGGTASPTLIAGQAPCLVDESKATSATVLEQGTKAKLYYALDQVQLDWKELDLMTEGSIPHIEAAAILRQLGLKQIDAAKGIWDCPPWRLDLKRSCDLLEEIVRVYGLENIPSSFQSIYMEESAQDRTHDFRMNLAHKLAGMGLWESQGFKLIADDTVDPTVACVKYSFPFRPMIAGDTIRVSLPISEDHATLRPSLAPGLLAVAARNINRGADSIRLFEMGRIFRNTGGGKGKDIEQEAVGILLAGKKNPASWADTKPDELAFADLKAIIEQLVPRATITCSPALPRPNAAIGVDVQINGKPCGFMARLALDACRKLGLPIDTSYAGLDLRKLQQVALTPFKSKELPQFPGSSRDASLELPIETKHAAIVKAILASKQNLLVSYALKDVYLDPTGEKLAQDRKAMTYTFLYRDAKKTLTSAEADAAHKQVLDTLAKQLKNLKLR